MESTTSITQLPVEILEEILLNLSQRNLLQCQSVCRQWHSLITTSPALLHKLFFVPGTFVNGKVQANRLLEELFPPFVFTKQRVSRNALLPPVSVQWLKSLPWYKSEARRAAVLRQDASWRRMFLSHPAPILGDITALDIVGNNSVKTFVGELGIPDTDAPIFERGVQMGMLFDIAVHMVDSVLWGGDFSVHWRMVHFGLGVDRGTVIEGKEPVLLVDLYAERKAIVLNRANLSARRSGLHVASLTPGFIHFMRVGDVPRRRRSSFSA
ncbi:hypothetical protein CDV55_104214 [Aspergillus turcosus]|uniref:F-box domain-containing protein n=1 Tax=Aspergillus turcosus TaxID=1245748 RepID=A0A229X1P4_9EURO|nr:hypothetical protein CDV55_104214 [Aspergillus turcosus]RLL95954.1 hypothetical protein CFD26_103485 [Aspergillus turcosus]